VFRLRRWPGVNDNIWGNAPRYAAIRRKLSMSMVREFKEFAMRGNVVDLAVGVIMGAAFAPIVSTLVEKVIMPPIGLAVGGADFSGYKLVLKAADAATKAPEVAMSYGLFVNALINFAITAFAIFMLVRAINTMKKKFEAEKAAEPAPPPAASETYLKEIRDALVKR
jgi:large conductance mechanosensitive channel